MKFNEIEKKGVRAKPERETILDFEKHASEKDMQILEEYESAIRSYRSHGETVPKSYILLEDIGKTRYYRVMGTALRYQGPPSKETS